MSKYKGMTSYGVTTKDIKEYASEHNLDPTDVWTRVIDKFVENGATEYEGYSFNCWDDYVEIWDKWHYCYVTEQNETLHLDTTYGITIISVKELLEENVGTSTFPSSGVNEDVVDVAPISDLRCMRTFPMSLYKNKEDLYKDKAEYYKGLFNKLLEHAMYTELVIKDDDGNLVNTNDGNYLYED